MEKLYPSFVSGNVVQFTLPTGTKYTELIFPCSFKKLKLMQNNLQIYLWKKNEERIPTSPTFCINNDISFPVVNGKSPNTLNLVRNNAQALQDVTFVIEEIGGVGDAHYWDYGLDVLSGIINPNMRAVIKLQPDNTTARAGETTSFSIIADGAISKYQWFVKTELGWLGLNDSDSATYSFTMTESDDGNEYKCVVTSIYGETVDSDPVKVTLDTTPAPENNTRENVEENINNEIKENIEEKKIEEPIDFISEDEIESEVE